MKILITGAAGQLGAELCHALWPDGCTLVALDRAALDITDQDAVRRAVGGVDCVINAAAYTKCDDAESNRDLAFRINAEAPGLLGRACADKNIPLVHISTDYVFSGDDHTPIGEDVAPHPVNVYGESKVAGEEAVRAATPAHIILRVGWLYATQGQNFARTMLRLGAERDELGVVDDQHGTPTTARDVAQAIAAIVGRWQTSAPEYGTFHYAAVGAATWYAFAREIFSVAEGYGYRAPVLKSITTPDYPLPAKRPEYSVLDCSRIDAVYAPPRHPWRDGVRDIVGELLSS